MIGATTISGGGALLKGLEACLEEQGIEISGIANPFTGFSVDALRSGVQDVGEIGAQVHYSGWTGNRRLLERRERAG